MLRIDEVYAFVAENAEGEGVMGATLPIGGQMMMTALVAADIERVKQLLPIAEKISRLTGTPFRILKFSSREDVTEKLVNR